MATWQVQTNKHPEIGGWAWGWIEGPIPRIYWSNKPGSGHPTREQAYRMVREHNDAEGEAPKGAPR